MHTYTKYTYVPSMPRYRDPDVAEAENLIVASRLLQDAGRREEAESLAMQARALFDGVPYDKKRQARVLGRASCLPDGTLVCRTNWLDDFVEVASAPYEDNGEAETARKAAGAAMFGKLVTECAQDAGIGWLAAAQLSAAMSGRPVSRLSKSLAKAVASMCGAADAARRAGWSGPASDMFRAAMRKSWLLDEPLGNQRMRRDAESLSRAGRMSADEGVPTKEGGWILWFPPDVLESLAAGIKQYENVLLCRDDVFQSIRRAMPFMRGAHYPIYREWERYDTAGKIADEAVRASSESAGIAMERLSGAGNEIAANIDTALARAMHAKRLVDAYRVFQQAADRAADTEALFLRTGFLAKDAPCLPDGPEWYGNIAAAVLEPGWRGFNTYVVKGEDSRDAPLTAAFHEAVMGHGRASIREWFATDEARALFKDSRGAYRNCPYARHGGKEAPET